MSQHSQQSVQQLLDKSKVDSSFKASIIHYMDRNLAALPKREKIICCSDIIESIFGKLKNKVSHNPEVGLTDGSLALANYGKKYEVQQIKQAMEQTTVVDIRQWRSENVPQTVKQKKKELFKNVGKKTA